MNELKPCPFCGSKDVEIRKGLLFAGFACCNSCTADVAFDSDTNLFDDSGWEENLISKWNKRGSAKMDKE